VDAKKKKKGPKSVLGKLWGSGKGKFRTDGKYSSATVRGTIWLVADRCDGTLTKVRRGVVSVRDIKRKKTVKVKAGHSYLASAVTSKSRRKNK
jgi:ferric-dicitrate binding protein FerR (iron transport regulator)